MSCFSEWVTVVTLSVMTTDNGMQKSQPPEQICILISHQLPVRHSALFLFFSFFTNSWDRKQIAFQSRQGCDNLSFQSKSSVWGADVLFHTSLVAYSCVETSVCHVDTHCITHGHVWGVSSCYYINLQGIWQKRKNITMQGLRWKAHCAV